ncbi:DUF2804 domain-containing protein [Paractinoplanes atraurantiacus]|uniref:DUF2804 domain-containing protein n=1 Tax=Paractinoplanes atraurantiacus TaxID=1036182 RepID=A0A285J260_9ACTN|nr:DUF2804 domain-containing protein [Actinoplanes atraurantiacus]SNY54405.1 Protein of unknown function [Actinoplanes atraurantiacus]
MIEERELTAEVDLCRPDGRLNPDAVGWTRRPLHRANLRGWGRGKRWEYWGIVTPSHIVGVVVSSLDYAGVHGIYVLDRVSGRETRADATVLLDRATVLPDRSGSGRVSAHAGDLRIEIDPAHLKASAPGIELDLVIEKGGESLGVVVPFSDRLFQYTVKDVGRPVSGTLRLSGTEYPVPRERSFAVLDHGRGRWPYAVTWNWAAGAGPGRAIQLGGRWTDGTGSTENAVFVDGRLHKISEDLTWEYSDWLGPWRIHGERADVRFEPFHERVARTNLAVLSSETHQCFGHFTGWALDDHDKKVDLDGLTGWAEEARNRW